MKEPNWKVMKNETEFTGAMDSFAAIAKYRDEIDAVIRFIHELYRYGGGPIIWSDHSSRQNAPLYLVSHHSCNNAETR